MRQLTRRALMVAGSALVLFGARDLAFAEPLSIRSASLEVTVDPGKGTFSLSSIPGDARFLTEGKLSGPAQQSKTIEVTEKTFGKGQGIEVVFADGSREEVDLFADCPFALFRSTLHNGGAAETRVASIQPFGAAVDSGKAPSELRVLSTAGHQPADQKTGGYEWIAVAVADLATRHGVVAGWITHDRAGGVKVVGATRMNCGIAVPGENWRVASVELSPEDRAASVKIANKPATGGVRVGIDSPNSREVSWRVRFQH